MDMGHVYHHAMERVVRYMLRRHSRWADLREGERESVVRTATQEIGQSLRNEVLLGTARNRHLLQRIENTLGQVIANQTAIEERGRFRPMMARIQFGYAGKPAAGKLPAYPLRTPAGSHAMLRGKIDRVDLLENGVEFAGGRLQARPVAVAAG